MIEESMVLQAVNDALAELQQSITLDSLQSNAMSQASCPCTAFGPSVLALMGKALAYSAGEVDLMSEPLLGVPNTVANQSFCNVMLMSKDYSMLNHNFSVYFASNQQVYLIQTFVEHSVRISRPMAKEDLLKLWGQLWSDSWRVAYEGLFGVAPGTLGGPVIHNSGDADNTPFSEQHIVVLTGPKPNAEQ